VHPKGAGKTDEFIAEHVGVGAAMVGRHRKKLEDDSIIDRVTTRTGRDGRTTNTANIGTTGRPRYVAKILAVLPEAQREGCYTDYVDLCHERGEEPTAEGLRAKAAEWQADNDPYVEPPDGDPDAFEPEPTEPPTPTREATLTPCERFRKPHEKAILAWVEKHPDDRQPIACWLENLARGIRSKV